MIGSALVALVAAGGCGDGRDSDPVAGTPEQLINLPDLSPFDDFSPFISQDGQKAVFLSRRDAGAFRVYLYDEALESKRVRLADRVPLLDGEQEWAASLRSDGSWLAVSRQGPAGARLVLSDWSGQIVAVLSLAGERVLDVALAPSSSNNVLAVVTEKDGAVSLNLYTYELSEQTVTLTRRPESFTGESKPQFVLSNQGQLLLFTRGANARLVRTWNGSSWELDADLLALTSQDARRLGTPYAEGYLQIQSLRRTRTKAKLGTFSKKPEGYVDQVGIIDEVTPFVPFGSSPFDFSASSYRIYEPSALSSLSSSPDGAYLLITGADSYFCETRSQPFGVMLLVRTSDMRTVPLFLQREIGAKSWTGIATNPCAVYDKTELASKQEFDTRIGSAQLLSLGANRFGILYESSFTGEREIRRAVMDVDWNNLSVGNVQITDLSANSPPSP